MASGSTDKNFEELALASLEAGTDMDGTLLALKEAGATAADCIRILGVIGIDRKDAQELVATSDAWRDLFQLARDNRHPD